MRTFVTIWAGQLLSLVGTAMTRFALLVWAYDQTGTATSVALIFLASTLPMVLVSPIAGVIVDRFDRRAVMLVTDFAAGVATLALLGLHLGGHLQIWHVYLLMGISGFFGAFQEPAYLAATTLLVERKHYARTNGMNMVADSGAELLSPFFAALLLPVTGLAGVMLVDVATFLIAVLTLAVVRVPRPEPVEDESPHFAEQMQTGFRFIFARRGLVGLMLALMAMNFTGALTYMSLLPVMVLGKTGGDEIALAWVQGAMGVGGLLGGLLVSTFGLPRRLIHGVLLFAVLSFALGDGQLALGHSVWQWALGGFLAAVFIPGIWGSYRTLWQLKTPPGIQGRVFAADNMLRQSMLPVGLLLAGPLADGMFEPAMAEGGVLADVFGVWVGMGEGAGIALMFLCTAVMGTVFSLSGYLFPALRNVQDDLPDYEPAPVAPQTL